MLENKKNHVVIEPDQTVLTSLKKNKKNFKAKFNILTTPISNFPLYFIKNGLGSFVTKNNNDNINTIKIKTITYKKLLDKYKLKFNVLILDCEGCMFNLFEENPELYKTLELIIFEKDNEKNCDYVKIIKNLKLNNFVLIDNLLNGFQQVWIKNKK
jgi:FkbM family methyltransferase